MVTEGRTESDAAARDMNTAVGAEETLEVVREDLRDEAPSPDAASSRLSTSIVGTASKMDAGSIRQGSGTINGVVENNEGAVTDVAYVTETEGRRVPERQTFSGRVETVGVDVGKARHRIDGVL